MIDLSAYPASLVISVFVGVAMTFLKQILETTVLKSTNPLHDNVLRFLAVALGIGMTFGYIGVPMTRPELWNQIALGAVAGLGAIGTFHLLASSTSTDPVLTAVQQALAQTGKPNQVEETVKKIAPTLQAIQQALDTAKYPNK